MAAKNKPVPVVAHQANDAFKKLILESQGQLSPTLRQTFLAQQKAQVLQSLKKQGKLVDPALLAWVDQDQDATDAIYGTICPADPNILLNMDQLWQDQGADFTKKYKHLSLAAAVARRGFGVGPMAGFGKWSATYAQVREAVEAGKDPAKSLLTGKDRTSHLLPANEADKLAFKQVSAYLKTQKITNRQAIEDESHFASVEEVIKKADSKMKVIHVVKGLLITEGSRPPQRSQTPKVADYFKFLVKINETPAAELPLAEGQSWPIFPTTSAPWPLMMPLTHGIPLDEASFIWEKFQGKHGEKRLHNYGPYRKGKKAFHPTFDDRPWHWSSYPATIMEGGVCGTMSTISMQAYTALGKPILKAGQPGHSCTVGYNVSSDGKFIAGVGQSATASPSGTGTNWLFKDGASWKCYGHNTNAVHHYGLALSMNPGLGSYMDSRIGLHLYRHLSDSDKHTVGRKLLTSILKKNPYNTELWYTLAKDSLEMDQLITLLEDLDKYIKASGLSEQVVMRDASAAIADASTRKSKKHSAGVVSSYKNYVKEAIWTYAFANPKKFSPSDQKLGLAYLEKLRGGKNKDLLLACDRFRAAVNGSGPIKQEVESELALVIKGNKKGESPKKLSGKLKRTMDQIDQLVTDRTERESWLEGLLTQFPDSRAARKNKAGKIKLDPVYGAICSALKRSYGLEPKNKKALKTLHTKNKNLTKG